MWGMYGRQAFEFCIKRAANELSGVIDTALSLVAFKGSSNLSTKFARCPGLVQKWNINFIALLLLTAKGQRPQKFAQMICRDGLTLAEMRWQLSRVVRDDTVTERQLKALDPRAATAAIVPSLAMVILGSKWL
jgi:hypothetical protein